MSRELQLRIISALVLAAIVLLACWLGGIWFRIFACVFGGLVYYEWTEIIRNERDNRQAVILGWLGFGIAFVALIFDANSLAIGCVVLTAAVALAVTIKTELNAWPAVGVLYAGLPAIAIAELRGSDFIGLIAILFLFAIVWGTDIFAYFCGRAIGGRKLAPAISPGKTWSGAIFGGKF